MNIVLDTNVLAFALLKPDGPPAAILYLIVNDRITLLYDNRILHEYLNVLRREKFGFRVESVDAIISFIAAEGKCVTAEPAGVFVDDGDRKHFPNDRRTINPADFLKLYLRI